MSGRTVADFCRDLGVTRQAVWNRVRSGRMSRPVKVGPRIHVWFEPEYNRMLRLWKRSAAVRAAATRLRRIAKAKERVKALRLRLAKAKVDLALATRRRPPVAG
jgi:predicted DNA-binding transcriptional regulator AlpA